MLKRGAQAWMFRYWGPPGPHDLETYYITPDVRITTKHLVKPAMLRLAAIMAAHEYVIRPGVTGAYNYRRVRGSIAWSTHSWGTAVDINWDKNPMTSQLITDMPPAMIDEIEAIKTVDGLPVFRWGGRYRRKKDAMHFEVMVTPEELSRGLADDISKAGNQQATKDDDDMIRPGDRGDHVKQCQRLINGVIARTTAQGWTDDRVATITLDGVYGPKTQAAMAHAMGRAQTITGIDLDGDWTTDTVTPVMVAILAQAVVMLGQQK